MRNHLIYCLENQRFCPFPTAGLGHFFSPYQQHCVFHKIPYRELSQVLRNTALCNEANTAPNIYEDLTDSQLMESLSQREAKKRRHIFYDVTLFVYYSCATPTSTQTFYFEV